MRSIRVVTGTIDLNSVMFNVFQLEELRYLLTF